jgi:hypothetical protein
MEYHYADDHFERVKLIFADILGDELWIPPKLSELDYQVLKNDGDSRRRLVCSFKIGTFNISFDRVITEGTLHAFFMGIREALFSHFTSLEKLTLIRFMQTAKARQTSLDPDGNFGFEATVDVMLYIQNRRGGEFGFGVEGCKDFVEAAFLVVLDAFTFFVNSEKAYTNALRQFLLGNKDGRLREVVLPALAKNNDYSLIARELNKEVEEKRQKPRSLGISDESTKH